MSKKILILQFPNLNNYGTGMMGLVTIKTIVQHFRGERIEFYCDFDQNANISEIKEELGEDICLYKWENPISNYSSHNVLFRKISVLNSFIKGKGIKDKNLIIVLGGDGFSEEYGNTAFFEFFRLWCFSLKVPVVLLGQTMGPFNSVVNRFFIHLLNRIKIFARDKWCFDYLKNEFCLRQVFLSTDLAFYALPKQSDKNIEYNVLKEFSLNTNEYITFVVSGIQGSSYYCPDKDLYLENWKRIIMGISEIKALNEKKIVLLAHTFYPYGSEDKIIDKVYSMLPCDLQCRVVLITKRVLQTRARFILGNGLFTVTGRMHASVSTFQMGKPAIPLAYSPKYEGVIGFGLGRKDLIVEANDPKKWESYTIVSEVLDKVCYIFQNYDRLCEEIQESISNQKVILSETFDVMLKDL